MPDGLPPSCSVIVPTRDRPAPLAACLEAIAALDHPRERLDVIVVNDGGSAVAAVVGHFAGRLDVAIVRTDGIGPAGARNRAAERARGDLLVFTDDDCVPAPDWICALLGRWAGDSKLAVGGRTTNGIPGNACAAASQAIVDLVYAHHNADPARARFLASNNLAVPADGFRELGGFDERFRTSEDRDFCARWLASGRRLVYADEALVVHAPRLTPAGFCRRHFAYGRGAYRYHRARPGSTAGSVRAELLFHRRLPRLLRPVLAGVDRRQAAPLAGLLAVWQLANAAGFAWEALRSRFADA